MMSSVRSTLIKSCMTNIHKEISQLEHWLNHLPEQPVPSGPEDVTTLHQKIDELSKQIELQQITLNHLSDQLAFMESTRQIHIDDSPWLDGRTVPLSNEVMEGEDDISDLQGDISDLYYTFHKQPTFDSVSTVSTVPTVPVANSSPVDDVPLPKAVPVLRAVPMPSTTHPVEKAQPPTSQEVAAEEAEEAEEEVEEEAEEEVEVEEEEVEVEEEEAEEEVEEEVEVEEITYKNKKYYKNSEGFIYAIEEDEQPSENPVGYWKEKTNSIAFYKLT